MNVKLNKKIALILTSCLFSYNAMAKTQSFADAWHYIAKNSDRIAAQKANVASMQAKQDATSDLYLPKVTLRGNYTRFDKPIELDLGDLNPFGSLNATEKNALKTSLVSILHKELTADQFRAFMSLEPKLANTITELNKDEFLSSSITAIWPIFTGGQISAAQIIAKGATHEASAMLKMVKQGQFEYITKIYFGVILAKKVAQTKLEAEHTLAKHFQNAYKLKQQGQIARVELLAAEAAYEKAKVDATSSKRNLEIALSALKSCLHQKKTVIPGENLFINTKVPSLETLTKRTLASYPGLQILKAKTEQVNGLIKVQQGKYMPQVFAYGNYNLYEDDSITTKLTPDWVVGVGVNLTLIDSSGRSGNLEAAYKTKLQVKSLTRQAERDLTVLVEKNYQETNQAIEEYLGLETSLNMAYENLKLREKAFTQGLATSINVVDAELFVQAIKTQRLAAAYKYVVSLSKLLALSNQIDDFFAYQTINNIEVK